MDNIKSINNQEVHVRLKVICNIQQSNQATGRIQNKKVQKNSVIFPSLVWLTPLLKEFAIFNSRSFEFFTFVTIKTFISSKSALAIFEFASPGFFFKYLEQNVSVNVNSISKVYIVVKYLILT